MKRFIAVITTISFLINTIANAAHISPIEGYSAFNSLSNEIIKNLFIPESYGSIVDRWGRGNSKKFIINIQDAHCNYEAQQNIAKILKILIMDYGIDLVGVEGAEGDLDLSQYGGYKDQRAKEKALDIYVKKGYVTGSEYLNILKYNKLPFGIYGVEDGELYLENFIRFRESWGNIKEIDCFMDELAKIIEVLKIRIYPDELLEFTKKCDEYENNNISLTEWVRFLEKKKPVRMSVGGNQKNFIFVLRAIRLEEGIDFKEVEKEREELIKWLEKNLPKEELEILVKKSLEYRLGKIPQVGYYEYLEKYLHIGHYNYLCKYINLVKIQSRINSDELFNEIEEITCDIKKALFQNEIQRRLNDTSYKIRILERLFHLKLSRRELEYYENNRDEFNINKIIDFIKIQCGVNNINISHILSDASFIGKIKENLLPASSFYRLAIMRDEELVKNLLLKMDMKNKDSAIIITGGFHTNGVKRLLRENGINYMVITPRITKAQPDNTYLSIMLDERIRCVRKTDQGQYMIAPPEVIDPNGNGIEGLDMTHFSGIRKELKKLIEGFTKGEIKKDEFSEQVKDIKLTEEEISMVKKIIEEIKDRRVRHILEGIFGLQRGEEEIKKLLDKAKDIYLGNDKEGAIKFLGKLREIEDEIVVKGLVNYVEEDMKSPQNLFIYFLLKEILPIQKPGVIGTVLASIYRIYKDTEDMRLRERPLNILIYCMQGLDYEYLEETAGIVVGDLLERGRIRISITPDIVSGISETEFERYFDIDGGIIYFKDDFYTRLKVERNEEFLKRLKGALDIYTKESFNLSNMKKIYSFLMNYNLVEYTLTKLEEGCGNVEARIFTVSILVEYGGRFLLQENCSRIIGIIDTIYKETDNPYHKEKLIGCIRKIAEIDNFLQDKEVLANLIKEEMGQIIESINSMGIRLKEGGEDFKKTRKEQLVLMKRMELYLEILEILSKKALECGDNESRAFGDSILGYMLEMVEKSIREKWDPNIQAEIISDLGYFIGIGHDRVFQWFLDKLEPDIRPEDRNKILDSFDCSHEFQSVVFDWNKINERTAYLILYRNHKNWELLEDIIYNQKIDIRFRIYAFTWYVLKFLDGEVSDIGKFQEMVDCLKDDAEGFVREISRDSRRIEGLIEDRILQDEEAKVYVMANFLMLKKYIFADITAKGFVEIAKLISNTRVRGYWVNANSNFVLGGRVLRMANKNAFFPIIAHELMHNILSYEYRMYSGFNREIDIFHEFMADISCFATAEIIGVAPEEIMQELGYEHHLKDVQEGDYISLEGHEGARALLQMIMKAFLEEGVKIEWKTFLEKAMDTLRNKTIRSVSLRAVIGFMIMRYLGVKEEDATQRALEFSSRYHPSESDQISKSKIPNGNEIGQIIRDSSEKGFVLGESVMSLALLSSIIAGVFTWDNIGRLFQEPYIFALLGMIFAIVLILTFYSMKKGSKTRSRAPIAIKGTIIFFSAILATLCFAVGVIKTLYTLGPGLDDILIQFIPLGTIFFLFMARNILSMIKGGWRGPKLPILILAFLISSFFFLGAPMAQTMDMKSPPTILKELLYTRDLEPEDKLEIALDIYEDILPKELKGYSDIPIVLSPMTDAKADTNAHEEKKFDRGKIKIRISVPWMEGKLSYQPPTALYVAAVLRHEIQHIIEAEGVSNVFEWWWALHKHYLFGGEKRAFGKELELIKRYNEKYNMGIDISLYDEYDIITKTGYNIEYFRKRVRLLLMDLLITGVILLGLWKIFLGRICGDFILNKYKKLEEFVRNLYERMTGEGKGLDIEAISRKLRVDKDALVGLSIDLENEEKTNELRKEFFRLVKEGGVTEGEMKILVEKTEKVVSATVDRMIEDRVLIDREVLDCFIIRVTLYLSIGEIKNKKRSEEPPECIKEFRDRLLEIAPDSSKVDGLIAELMGMREYTFDRGGNKILLKADIYLKKILEIFKGDEKLKLSINEVRRYLYSRAGVKGPLPDSSIDGFRKGIEDDLVSDLKAGKLMELSSDTIFLQDLGLYVSDDRNWDLENLDEITLWIIKELIGRGKLVFTYDKEDKMEKFIELLKAKGVPEREITDWELYDKLVFIDISYCKNYEDVRGELQRFLLPDLPNRRLVSMVKRDSERFRGNNLRDRIILACKEGAEINEGEEILDLYLMWKVALIFGRLENYDFSTDGMNIIGETFRDDMRKLLRAYYKGTDLINNIDEIIHKMIEGFYLILPPLVPFIRDYYNALVIANDLIRKSV